MNRRELVKAVGRILVSYKTACLSFQLKPSPEYIVFYDPKLMGLDFVERSKSFFPPNTVFYSVTVPTGKTLDDAIRIFQ